MAALSATAALLVIASTSGTSSTADPRDRALATEARIETIVELILERNPLLVEARERVRGAREGARARSRLPDLELKYEQWGVPLARPWALDEADTLMLGLRQTFPAPGTLGARERAAIAGADAAAELERARALDLVRDARRGYAEYLRASEEYRIHLDHLALAEELVALSRASYQAGGSDQADLLRAIAARSRLHGDVALIEQARSSAVAFLNALMLRAPDAPLGPARAVPPPGTTTDDATALERQAIEHRPELHAANGAIARSTAELDAARASAVWPSFMVGLDYWLMPAAEVHHAYGAMVAINLPWLSGRRGDEIAEAERVLAADRSALASAESTVRFEVHDRLARLRAYEKNLAILDEELIPQTRQAYEAARASFAAGRGSAFAVLDALRMRLDAELDAVRARAEVEKAVAEVDRAAGRGLPANEGVSHD